MYVLKRINKRNAGIRKRTRFIEAPIRIVTNIFPNKGIVSTPDFGRNGFPAYGSPEIRRSGAGQSVPKDLFLSLKRYRPGSSLSLPGKGRLDAEQGGLRSDEELEFSFSLASFRGRGGQRHRGFPPFGHGKEEGKGPGGQQGGEKAAIAVRFHDRSPDGRRMPAFPTIVRQIRRPAKRERIARKDFEGAGRALRLRGKNMIIVEIQAETNPGPDGRI